MAVLDIDTEVKSFLKITGATYDTLITQLILNVTNQIENYCQQPIIARTVQVTDMQVDLINNKLILLPYSNPVSIVSLQYKSYELGETLETIDSDYYEIVIRGNVYFLILELADNSTWAPENYIYNVYVEVGWALASVPEEVNQVAVEMVVSLFQQSTYGENRFEKSTINENLGGAALNTVYSSSLNRWKDILDKYRRMTL